MANPNGRKGSQWETDLLNWFRHLGFSAERLARKGTKDEGDLVVKTSVFDVVVEAKNEKRIDLASYVKEAAVERDHYCEARGYDPTHFPTVAVVKRRNHSVKDAYVVLTLEEFTQKLL